jgi:adenine-specific DNA-methyltransferase
MIKDILLKNESVTSNAKTLELLHTHFPQCFNKIGEFDIDKFKDQIKIDVDVTHEGYDLNFLGRNYSKLLASVDTTTVILPDMEHNAKPENANSQNLYISGDNLDGLKHLLKSYAGAVKCIYIDPPYNTGTDGFVYNDKFNFSLEELTSKLSINDEQAQKILDLTRRGSASHSAWLTFMYPRLLLARDLLKSDGVIFISIDDNEQANLKMLCDNIFGEENFVSEIIWKGKGGGADNKYLMQTIEYVLMYTKIKEDFVIGEEIKVGENFPKLDATKNRRYKTQLARKWGSNSKKSDRPNLFYSILAPDGSEVFPMLTEEDEGCWRWGKERMQKEQSNGNVEFTFADNRWIVYEKIYEPLVGENKTKKFANLFEDTGNTAQGTNEIKSLFSDKVFDFPKPISLIKRLIEISNPEKNSIVLDFFSGSATTAHAVLDFNASYSGFCKFVMIQWPEKCKVGSVAERSGYKAIDEIGQERIRRAAAKIKAETVADIDYGFKHYTLVEPSADTLDKLEEFTADKIFTNNDTLSLFGKETVLETWLVKDGYGFGAKVQEVKLVDYTVYLCGKHLYFIEAGINENDLVALLDKYQQEPTFSPENIVVFGYSFNFSQTEMLRKNLYVLKDSYKNLKANFAIRY